MPRNQIVNPFRILSVSHAAQMQKLEIAEMGHD
jgi:hypothetical protein